MKRLSISSQIKLSLELARLRGEGAKKALSEGNILLASTYAESAWHWAGAAERLKEEVENGIYQAEDYY